MNKSLRDYWDVKPNIFKRTPEGYLTGVICVTGAGVFSYRTADGVKRRLRPVEQVSDFDSIQSVNNKPVTFWHPAEDVNPDNIKKLSVGFTANDAYFDGLNIFVTLTVTDRKAIEAIDRGELRAVSCGYEATMQPGSGVWQGVEYDEAMTAIKYNHVALVYEGRAGDGVRFSVGDSMDGEKFLNHKPKDNDSMKKLVIDNAQYDVDEAVLNAYNGALKARDEADAKAAAMADEKAKAEAARDAAQAELKKAQDAAPSAETLAKMVADHIDLINTAKEKGVEVKATDSAEEIKKAVIKAAYKDIELDGKSAAYIDGLFDAAKAMKPAAAQTGSAFAGAPAAKNNVNDAYEKMCAELDHKKKEA